MNDPAGSHDISFSVVPSKTCDLSFPLPDEWTGKTALPVQLEIRSSFPNQTVLFYLDSSIEEIYRSKPVGNLPAEPIWHNDALELTSPAPLRANTFLRLRFQPRDGEVAEAASFWIKRLRFEPPAPAAPVSAPPPAPLSRFPFQWAGIALIVLGGFGLWRTARQRTHRQLSVERALSPLFEINVRTWKSKRDEAGVIVSGSLANITDDDLKKLREDGFRSVWFMGIWTIGARVRVQSKRYGYDFMGSPFAIDDYSVSDEMGGESELLAATERARQAGLKVIVDFVPNHMGFDSRWISEHPEYFIHRVLTEEESRLSAEEIENANPGFFRFHTPSYPENGKRVPKVLLVAYGKDPYFYPWIDTAQLDYANPDTRQRMIGILTDLAKKVDGIRCDMAMLLLRESIRDHRHPEMSHADFDQVMPREFWTEAIEAVRRVNPDFVFMAETYWSKEGDLQRLGFDYTYNKPLYEAIVSAVHHGHAEGLLNFMRILGSEFLSKSVHFLENHDEDRAMNVIGEEKQVPAAVLLATLPGVALIHQGQMDGFRERLPVQRVLPLYNETPNTDLRTFYRQLLRMTNQSIFRKGRLHVLYANNGAIAAYARLYADERAIVIVNLSGQRQTGSVFISSEVRLRSTLTYLFDDLYFDLRKTDSTESGQRCYTYKGSGLIQDGLYVDLQPYDAHLFIVTPLRTGSAWKEPLAETVPPLPTPARPAVLELGRRLFETLKPTHS